MERLFTEAGPCVKDGMFVLPPTPVHKLKFLPPVFVDKAYKEIIKVKWDHKGGVLILQD